MTKKKRRRKIVPCTGTIDGQHYMVEEKIEWTSNTDTFAMKCKFCGKIDGDTIRKEIEEETEEQPCTWHGFV